MEIAETLELLVGPWRVARSIEDHRSGIHGSFQGTAAFTESRSRCDRADGARARFKESGELAFGTYIGRARRRLVYVRLDDTATAVYFTNGRPVDLDLSSGAWQSEHRCGDDRYEIATRARSPNVVEERWQVRGRLKDYDAVTTLVRVGRFSR